MRIFYIRCAAVLLRTGRRFFCIRFKTPSPLSDVRPLLFTDPAMGQGLTTRTETSLGWGQGICDHIAASKFRVVALAGPEQKDRLR